MTKTFSDDLAAEESQLFQTVFVRVAAVLQASQNLVADAIDPAAPGSPNHTARTDHVWDAYEQVNPLMYSAEDHLRTMLMLFEGTLLPTYSLYTLLRTAGEAIVRCAYLLDPNLTERERLARGLNVRWENLDEIRKLDRDELRFVERVKYLEARAAEHGIRVLRKSEGKPVSGFGEQRRRDVELFGQYITREHSTEDLKAPFGESVYRYLSAHVHSMIWVKLADAESMPTDEPEMKSVKLDIGFNKLAGMTLIVLRLHERNIEHLLRLSGYPLMVWEEARKTAISDAQARFRALGKRQ